ncbi:MAG TPA: hypothetical protein EYP92_04655 [Candidatus Thioglobus sp.]|jgi:hypothetical protein|nr:hypothetical protein [Candidatus Thioglobus sp.]HIL43184.1 hypothetical protein [Gammaproteobacteria bacterium]
MYRARLFASKHARTYESVYNLLSPIILRALKVIHKLSKNTLDTPITWLEKKIKGFLFDCQMCGNCVLSSTGMTCPMNCPKTLRNGPCGGVLENGNCEVKPDMECVWVNAWRGSRKMRNNLEIQQIQFAVNHEQEGSSAWIRLAKQEIEIKDYEH